MNSKTRLAIIGCGRAAEVIYLPILSKMNNVQVNAVVDPVDSRRKLFTSQFKECAEYNTLTPEMYNEIDAGIITTPPESHIGIASALLKNNKHVLVEKPLAVSIEGLKELIETEMSSTAKLVMGFNHRNWHPALKLKQHIANNNEIIKSIDVAFSSDYSKWNPVSFISDPLDDLGPHFFDLIRFIFEQEIVSVSAINLAKNDYQIKVLIENNIEITGRLAYLSETLKYISVVTSNKNYYLTIGSERMSPSKGTSRSLIDFYEQVQRKILGKSSSLRLSYEKQLNNFLINIKSNEKPTPDINDGIVSILVGIAARKSINNMGKEIFINEIKI